MSQENPEEFESLRKLLALKKYEQPPPGYYRRLPDQIRARIKADEDLSKESGWWTWMVARFDARPAMVCVYGCGLSALLLLGFRVSEEFEVQKAAAHHLQGGWLAASPDAVSATPSPFIQSHFANPAPLVYFGSGEPILQAESVAPASRLGRESSSSRSVSFRK